MGTRDHASAGPGRRPLIVGLLGGIASGKSTVTRLLAARGAAVLDADVLAREVLGDPQVLAQVVERFGEAVAPGGRPDREALAARVFHDPEDLRWLESLIHPRVKERIQEAVEVHTREGRVPAVVLDVPLLLETGSMRKSCDLLIFVDCPDEIRRQRVQKLRGWSDEEWRRREARQLPLAEKRRAAHFVLSNDGTPSELEHAFEQWFTRHGGFEGLARRIDSSRRDEDPHDRTLHE